MSRQNSIPQRYRLTEDELTEEPARPRRLTLDAEHTEEPARPRRRLTLATELTVEPARPRRRLTLAAGELSQPEPMDCLVDRIQEQLLSEFPSLYEDELRMVIETGVEAEMDLGLSESDIAERVISRISSDLYEIFPDYCEPEEEEEVWEVLFFWYKYDQD